MRLVVIEWNPSLVSYYTVLNVPEGMDLEQEKKLWLEGIGPDENHWDDMFYGFLKHLHSKGCTDASLETFEI